MKNWPEASRLSNALRERADADEDIDTGEAWERVQQLVADTSPSPAGRTHRRSRLVIASTIAGMAALVIGVLVVGVADRGDRRDRGLTPIDAPEPVSLSADGTCSAIAEFPIEYRTTGAAGDIDVVAVQGADVATARTARTIWAVAESGAASSSDAFEAVADPPSPLDVGVFVSVTPETTHESWEQSLRSVRQAVACPISPSVVVVASAEPDVGRLVVSATCSDVADIAYGGTVLVGPTIDPPPCPPRKPTFLIEPAADDAIPEQWAQRHGCRDPTSAVDDQGHRVTRWSVCDVTLIHVGLSTELPWTTTVEGLPMSEFVRSITSYAS